MDKPILVTGVAGFIGFHIARQLLGAGKTVVGIDNLNTYYDPALKQARLALLESEQSFLFLKRDIADRAAMEQLFDEHAFEYVIHMAAQAGVRYSLTHPHAYVSSNLIGFTNILEGCRHQQPKHLLFASSSSVYGVNAKTPFAIDNDTSHPISLYAATKKSNEVAAHAYAHLYGIPTTGLRLFTVYGPWGRPDMACLRFTKAIVDGTPIEVYQEGMLRRDFTYIDDVIEGMQRILSKPPVAGQQVPFQLLNIGNNSLVTVRELIRLIEEAVGRQAQITYAPMQPGDVPMTFADIAATEAVCGWRPQTALQDGISQMVDWYRAYAQRS